MYWVYSECTLVCIILSLKSFMNIEYRQSAVMQQFVYADKYFPETQLRQLN